jgi:hypothetical protein
MEAARTSETLVNFYQTTRCYNPEDSNLHTHRRENLKSYLMSEYVTVVCKSVLERLRTFQPLSTQVDTFQCVGDRKGRMDGWLDFSDSGVVGLHV